MKIVWGRSIGFNISLNSLDKYSTGGAMEYTIVENGADCYPWHEYFAIIPRKTVGGTRIFWTKAYKRRVWVVWGTGFHMEPHVQYATLFDLLTYDNTYTYNI
jgi:hypothetical protein